MRQANETIEYLVDALITQQTRNYDGCCLRMILLDKDRRNDCDKFSCVQCCQEAKLQYRAKLLKQYIVK